MNTHELERLLRRHVRVFDGVFSCDRLPSRPRLFVANTDSSSKPGEHWIAIYVPTMAATEHISIRLDVNPIACLNVTRMNIVVNGFLIIDSYKVPSVGSVDIIGRFCILRSRDISLPR